MAAMRCFALAAGLNALLVPAPAVAAAPDEPPWAAEPPPRPPASMMRTLDQYRYFTDCVAGREWVTARALFDTPIGSPEEGEVLDRITGGSRGTQCSYALQMRMTSMLLRGGIAESRYRQLYGDDAHPPAAAEAALASAGAGFAWVGFGRESPPRRLAAFAFCLAEREPAGAHAVLTARIGRREEREAWQALSRRFGACLVPGQRVHANPLTLRPTSSGVRSKRRFSDGSHLV